MKAALFALRFNELLGASITTPLTIFFFEPYQIATSLAILWFWQFYSFGNFDNYFLAGS